MAIDTAKPESDARLVAKPPAAADSVDMFSVSPNEGTTTWMAVDQLGAVIARSPRPNDCQWLAPSESERMATMSRRVRQDQFLAGRWLLREMLTSLFPPTQPTDWRLGGIAGKAPSILGCPPGASLRMPLFLSVSHSGEPVNCSCAMPTLPPTSATRCRPGSMAAIA